MTPRKEDVNHKFLNNRLKAMMGDDFEPVVKMAENAYRIQHILEEKLTDIEKTLSSGEMEPLEALKYLGDLTEANKEWERVAQFTNPKLKSVEHVQDSEFHIHVHRGEATGNQGE